MSNVSRQELCVGGEYASRLDALDGARLDDIRLDDPELADPRLDGATALGSLIAELYGNNTDLVSAILERDLWASRARCEDELLLQSGIDSAIGKSDGRPSRAGRESKQLLRSEIDSAFVGTNF